VFEVTGSGFAVFAATPGKPDYIGQSVSGAIRWAHLFRPNNCPSAMSRADDILYSPLGHKKLYLSSNRAQLLSNVCYRLFSCLP
jgi:hypothetical protein